MGCSLLMARYAWLAACSRVIRYDGTFYIQKGVVVKVNRHNRRVSGVAFTVTGSAPVMF